MTKTETWAVHQVGETLVSEPCTFALKCSACDVLTFASLTELNRSRIKYKAV